jgi:glycosyltransferase involved in cell wall biosynthesis
VLAISVMLRHLFDDPVRALTLAWRVLPAPLRDWLRFVGPYGRAAALWGAGDRRAALTTLEGTPAKLAAFSLAVDQPAVARSAIARLSSEDRARRWLAARLAYREGRLADAAAALDGARGWRAARLRRWLRAEAEMLESPPGGLGGGGGPPPPPPPRGVTGGSSPGGNTVPVIPGRVLHIVTDALPSASAGYTVRTQEIALAQRAIGLDPHVVTRIGFPVTAGTIDGRHLVIVDGVPYHRILPWIMPGRADTIARDGLRKAARLVHHVGPAVLHAASNYSNALIALALRDATRLPVVYEVRGFWEDTWLSRQAAAEPARQPAAADDLTTSDRYQRSRALETYCMQSADLVVTLGEAMKNEILGRGIPEEKILIVPNAVSHQFLRPLPDGAELRRTLGISDGEHVVGLVSSLVPHEGIPALLEAGKILNDRGVRTRVLIVGDGPERGALQRQATALGLDAIFTGRVPMARVREYHAVLDVFVVPRTPDRVCQLVTPLKPVEAMASGLAVVVSAVDALGEIVRDKVTGAQVPPGDAEALADCLQQLLGDPELRKKLGDNAREWVAADRTWERNAQRYRDAYARLGAL